MTHARLCAIDRRAPPTSAIVYKESEGVARGKGLARARRAGAEREWGLVGRASGFRPNARRHFFSVFIFFNFLMQIGFYVLNPYSNAQLKFQHGMQLYLRYLFYSFIRANDSSRKCTNTPYIL